MKNYLLDMKKSKNFRKIIGLGTGLALSATSLIALGGNLINEHIIHRNDGKLYLQKLDKNNEIKVTRGDKVVRINNKDGQLYAITEDKKTKSGLDYASYVYDSKTKKYLGTYEIDGKDLKYVDSAYIIDNKEIKVSDLEKMKTTTGVWAREKAKIDHNTEKAQLLEKDTQVVSDGVIKTTKDDRDWYNIIYIDANDKKDQLKSYYSDSDYYINKELFFDENYSSQFYAKVPKNVRLNIRKSPTTKEKNIITSINDGEKVIILPGIEGISHDSEKGDNKHDWLPVAYYDGKKVITGWCAATEYRNNDEKNYLVTPEKYKELKQQEKERKLAQSRKKDKITRKEVDTSSVSGVDLKIRKKCGLKGKVISRIENGSIIKVYEKSMKKPKSKDGYKWVKVKLANGRKGYCAKEYLTNITNTNIKKGDKSKLELINNKDFEGYYGIDVNNCVNHKAFKELIESNHDYKYNKGKVKLSNGTEKTVKMIPSFVIFKIGATGYSKNCKANEIKFSPNNDEYIENVNKNVDTCEKNNIPYGFYYFSQAITKEEAKKEVEEMVRLYNKIDKGKNNMLDFYIDIETSEKHRIKKGAEINGQRKQVEYLNYMIKELKKRGINAKLYTDNNTIRGVLNKLNGVDVNKNLWIVDYSKTHTNNLNNLDKKILNKNSDILQIAGTTTVKTKAGNITVDMNFMKENAYKKYILTRQSKYKEAKIKKPKQEASYKYTFKGYNNREEYAQTNETQKTKKLA